MPQLSEKQEWWKQPCCMGIDEAGRGPVLGPMVYAAAFCPVSKMDYVKEKGFADSKTLTEAKREELLRAIKADSNVGWIVDSISPQSLSTKMLGVSKYNLNLISYDSAIGMVNAAIEAGVNVTELYVDTVGDAERYTERLSSIFQGVKCIAKAKADSLFPVVSAASIVAKVTRDEQVKNWVFEEKVPDISREFGCGYPGDAVTKQWLEDARDPVFGFPNFVRFSWQTTKRALETDAVPVEWEADLEDEGQGVANMFMASQAVSKTGQKQHSFFRTRKIRVVELAVGAAA